MDNFLSEMMDDFEADGDIEEVGKEENDSILDAVKQYQSNLQNHTCLMTEDMAAQVVVNKESVSMTISTEKSNEVLKYAPGEGKIPSNRMREEHSDVKAFPCHPPTGQYGFNHVRKIKLME